MKTPVILFALLCCACAASVDPEAEKSLITKLIDDETKYAASADLPNRAKCWSNSDDAIFHLTSADGTAEYRNWKAVEGMLVDAKPFELKLKRDNYRYTIGSDMAFVTFDQEDNWGGSQERRTRESRTLKKVDGEWKIVSANVIDITSFEEKNTGPVHIAKEKISVDPQTSLRAQPGLGGMYVGFVEVPAGTDFTPLFAGLPQDMCSSPHWGYIFEGSIRIKYADGKEEIVNKGEVFYWPAPHTAIVEKDVKFIDFSPEPELRTVLDHVGKKMASQNSQASNKPR